MSAIDAIADRLLALVEKGEARQTRLPVAGAAPPTGEKVPLGGAPKGTRKPRRKPHPIRDDLKEGAKEAGRATLGGARNVVSAPADIAKPTTPAGRGVQTATRSLLKANDDKMQWRAFTYRDSSGAVKTGAQNEKGNKVHDEEKARKLLARNNKGGDEAAAKPGKKGEGPQGEAPEGGEITIGDDGEPVQFLDTEEVDLIGLSPEAGMEEVPDLDGDEVAEDEDDEEDSEMTDMKEIQKALEDVIKDPPMLPAKDAKRSPDKVGTPTYPLGATIHNGRKAGDDLATEDAPEDADEYPHGTDRTKDISPATVTEGGKKVAGDAAEYEQIKKQVEAIEKADGYSRPVRAGMGAFLHEAKKKPATAKNPIAEAEDKARARMTAQRTGGNNAPHKQDAAAKEAAKVLKHEVADKAAHMAHFIKSGSAAFDPHCLTCTDVRMGYEDPSNFIQVLAKAIDTGLIEVGWLHPRDYATFHQEYPAYRAAIKGK